ncbi:heavy metal translocating P-type ATPase [Blattabacterium cuenoti]|uniref:heavy metal translocating P-type ATPase n=1 Tax=Blattabacterium cuenoti TaxID=1653831 RepID=UPI00163C5478|nr:HAD-IC family P-type ATPase [Blattabacterium cuenoti]
MKNYDFLNNEKISEKIIDFVHKNITRVHFFIPSIHCSSCVFILEDLPNKYSNILSSNVDFLNKKIWITFYNNNLKISDLAKILENIGYSPSTDLESFEKYDLSNSETNNKKNRNKIQKIAIFVFCFGNIMLLAIPEYVGSMSDPWYVNHRYFFRFMMMILSIPVFLFTIFDHIKYAIIGVKKKLINIDVPISMGILVIFFWSLYEILFDLGSGYFDSLSSFSLFILISKLFQVHTHNKIFSFNKNYKSFYPILITKVKNGVEKKIFVSSLEIGDIFVVKNEEIIPVDSILIKGKSILDNSFITGESNLIIKKIGDKIYAGSRQKGEAIYLKVVKKMDNSYLSILWKKGIKKNNNYYINSITTNVSKYFTPSIIIISLSSGIYWYIKNNIYNVFKTIFSILIITCPCALVLSSPLIFGNIIKFFSKKGLYIKDTLTVEKISSIKTLIFDKTGTLTDPNKEIINFIGKKISYNEKRMIASLLRNSSHPFSQKILSKLSIKNFYKINDFKEIPGKGLECKINNFTIKAGSMKYVSLCNSNKIKDKTLVAISINNKLLGYFYFKNFYRKGIQKLFNDLKKDYNIIVLSGDNNNIEKKYIKSILPKSSKILFNQSPEDKLNYIKKLQKNGIKVIMFGDGVNDSAALKKSEVGISVSDNPTSFFPSCDAFIKSDCLNKISYFLKISRISYLLVIINFIISLLYNILGIFFAITCKLNPLIASILMPISSFSVIIFSIISTCIISKKILWI